MAPYKLYQEPIQKYRELNTTDWTPTFTIQTNPTTVDNAEPILRGTVDNAEPMLRNTVNNAEPILRSTFSHTQGSLAVRERKSYAAGLVAATAVTTEALKPAGKRGTL
ncbi:hypothetical protein AAEP93_010898 [Penicillium crustosum]